MPDRGVTLKNRILRSATHEGMADTNGSPTEMMIKKYELLAKGEVGAIITGYAGIQQNGKSPMHNMLMIDSDAQIKSFQELTRRILVWHPDFLANCPLRQADPFQNNRLSNGCSVSDQR